MGSRSIYWCDKCGKRFSNNDLFDFRWGLVEEFRNNRSSGNPLHGTQHAELCSECIESIKSILNNWKEDRVEVYIKPYFEIDRKV